MATSCAHPGGTLPQRGCSAVDQLPPAPRCTVTGTQLQDGRPGASLSEGLRRPLTGGSFVRLDRLYLSGRSLATRTPVRAPDWSYSLIAGEDGAAPTRTDSSRRGRRPEQRRRCGLRIRWRCAGGGMGDASTSPGRDQGRAHAPEATRQGGRRRIAAWLCPRQGRGPEASKAEPLRRRQSRRPAIERKSARLAESSEAGVLYAPGERRAPGRRNPSAINEGQQPRHRRQDHRVSLTKRFWCRPGAP